jgi:hypothetical protein
LCSANGGELNDFLAAHRKSRYKLVRLQALSTYPKDESMSADGSVSTNDGIGTLLSKITEFWPIDSESPLYSRSKRRYKKAVN